MSEPWFDLKVKDKELMKNPEVKKWLDDARDALMKSPEVMELTEIIKKLSKDETDV